jgi:hypothetical protein
MSAAAASQEKIPSIDDLTELPEKMGDGITWYIDLTTLKIYGFSYISNTWFPSYDKDFDKLVICRILNIDINSIASFNLDNRSRF